MAKEEFKFEEQEEDLKRVITIYGYKGVGKTTVAFSFPGKKYCLSLDRKSLLVKKGMYANNEDIKVYDTIKYFSNNEDTLTETGNTSYDYAMFLLDEIEKEDDCQWLILDGLEIFELICEMRMRYDENLGAFQGIVNRNIWKNRRLLLKNFHRRAVDIAKKGVIYCTFSTKNEVIVEGTLLTKTDVPRWMDVIMYETDIVVHAKQVRLNDKKYYLGDVVTSKDTAFLDEEVYDLNDHIITDRVIFTHSK